VIVYPVCSGKRSWKQQESTTDGESRRSESNMLYRTHRLSGVEADAKKIVEFCGKDGRSLTPRHLARRLLTRLLYFSGGGTTDLMAVEGESGDISDGHNEQERARNVQHQLVNAAYLSFGLAEPLSELKVDMPSNVVFLKRRECNRILGAVGLQGGVVGKDGKIDFSRIFSTGLRDQKPRKKTAKKQVRALDIELGAGFGEWIVNQASENPSRDFVAVELRADRVGQIFNRAAAFAGSESLDNLCVVGAESGNFLRYHVKDSSISTIFVNHPEPPTQTFGAGTANLELIMEGGAEPAHMLNSRTLLAAAHCLVRSPEGKLVIVTDNKWYGRLLCATLVKVIRQNKGLLVSGDLKGISPGVKITESFPSTRDLQDEQSVTLFEGQASDAIGHMNKATSPSNVEGMSYFDRLWRTGAGTHAERSIRFIIVMVREETPL
jgi:hypothetical protein